MSHTAIRIGPEDHGRRMSLEDFEHAEAAEGYIYELGRGVVVVAGVPTIRHFAQLDNIRTQLYAYSVGRPVRIYAIAGIMECKLLIPGLISERHPDIAVYLHAPPSERNVWRKWIPEIVVEVVSRGSKKRDYVEKREEYLLLGVKEYWIVDSSRQEILALRRSGDEWVEEIVDASGTLQTPLLEGFELKAEPVFRAAENISE